MGFVLASTAFSVNIKERLDYSCAVFDKKGQLIANAQHIPVHLGSMSKSIQSVIQQVQTINEGDVFINNNPYKGGTHLPDLTVISPVFIHNFKKPFFFVASRGHHADIGGITPGSVPPFSININEEGIIIDCFKVVIKGVFQEKNLRDLLTNHPFPARNINQNIGDIQAQIAANQKGILELKKLTERFTIATINAYINFMYANAAKSIQQILPKIKNKKFIYKMDNHISIAVSIRVNKKQQTLSLDFTGTSLLQSNNFNAPTAICYSCVLYVLRTLITEPIPMNEGVFKVVSLIIPPDCMLNPKYPAAVVAGNVETSQCIVDTIYGALGIVAASQGTMNNLTFGNEKFQYYETICGGSGAGYGFHGRDAVHTHMTNSRLTDPEVLENRFPIVIDAFSIRKNSSGRGKWNGGNGVIRQIRFLEPMTAGMISNHRIVPPYGQNNGEAGKKGINLLIRADGKKIELKSNWVLDLNKNDMIVIMTPGGGGWGKK